MRYLMQKEDFDALTLEEKIGQLLFIGIPGPDFDDKTKALVEEIMPGGICLFARNIKSAEQTRKLLDDINAACKIPPFLSLDQEGGLVDRLRRVVTPMPAANEFKYKEDAANFGAIAAETIKQLGFNMNFAPVVDVNNAEREQFSNGLQSRVFGRSVEDVIELAGAFLDELNKAGIIGCLKHFPGLGAAEVDSHNELPRINISKDELESIDLEPYRRLLKPDGPNVVMIAHAAYPNIDLQETGQNGGLMPSSLSYNIVTGLLRETIGFEGVAVTDDLEMGAIVNNYGIGEASKMAVKAGVDMPAICAGEHSIREAHTALAEAVTGGEISEERIYESHKRISRSKIGLNVLPELNIERLNELSANIEKLKTHINQTGG